MPQDRQPKVMITGAAGNLGRAVAAHFAGLNAALLLVDVSLDALHRAYGDLPGDGSRQHIAADLTDAAATLAALAATPVDVLCNIAGGFRMGPRLHETPPETWALMLNLNAGSIVNVVRAVVPGMIAAGNGGAIINVAAYSALSGKAQMGPYTAAKSAVIRLTETLSAELKGDGINVNSVLPGVIDTPENRAAMPEADPALWVAPSALAAIIGFLASPAAKPIHGAALPVTGLG